jgi:hypothetical protein
MPSFVPRSLEPYQKQELFEKRVLQLRGVVGSGKDTYQIVKSAERLRLAALGLIKSKRQSLSHGNREKQLANLLQNEEYWLTITVDEIVTQFAAELDRTKQD